MKNIKKIVTCEAENLLWQESNIAPKEQEDCMHVINVYPQVKYQTIDGFGGAFTEASAHNYMAMSEAKKAEMIEAYFGEDGLKYNIGRVRISKTKTANLRHSVLNTTRQRSFRFCAMRLQNITL